MANNYSAKKKMTEIFKWTIKRNLSITVVYTILLFMSLPMLQVLLNVNEKMTNGHWEKSTGTMLASFLTMGVVVLFTVIFTLVNFHYLHSKRQEDLFESLPLAKKQVILAKYFAVIAETVVPAFIVMIIGGAITANLKSFREMVVLMGYMFIGVVANVTILVLLCLLCGNTIYVIVSHLLISVTLPIFMLIVAYYPENVLPTYVSGNYSANVFSALTPMFAPFFGMAHIVGAHSFKWHALYWIIVIAIALFIIIKYAGKRKSENAATKGMQPTVENIITIIASVTAAFITGILFTMAFALYYKAFVVNFSIGAFIGAVGTTIILRLIFHKRLDNAKYIIINIAASLALAIGFALVLSFDLTGFVNNVPEASDVESVSCESYYDYDGTSEIGNEYIGSVTDKKIIQSVINHHKDEVKKIEKLNKGFYSYRGGYEWNSGDDTEVNVTYHLKNGSTIRRKIAIGYKEFFAFSQENAKQFVKEYKGSTQGINVGSSQDSCGAIVKNRYYQKLRAAILADIKEHGLLVKPNAYSFSISVVTHNHSEPTLYLSGNYERTKAVLKDAGIKCAGRGNIKFDINFDNSKKIEKFPNHKVTINLPKDWESDEDLYVDLVKVDEDEDGNTDITTPHSYKDKKCVAKRIGEGKYEINMPIPKYKYSDYDLLIYKEKNGVAMYTGTIPVVASENKSVNLNIKRILYPNEVMAYDMTDCFYKYSFKLEDH